MDGPPPNGSTRIFTNLDKPKEVSGRIAFFYAGATIVIAFSGVCIAVVLTYISR